MTLKFTIHLFCKCYVLKSVVVLAFIYIRAPIVDVGYVPNVVK